MALTITIDAHAIFVINDQNLGKPIGTGFSFIKPHWVITAKHVVMDYGELRKNLSLISLKKDEVNVSVSFIHPTLDIAVLQIEDPSFCNTPLFPSHERFTGKNGLFYCGYSPLNSNREVKEYGMLVCTIPSYSKEERERDNETEQTIIFDAPDIEGGHSGGPILGAGGGVVGIIIDGISGENGSVGRATSVHALLKYLVFTFT